MSLGYLGRARLLEEDKEYAIYEYSGENWNDKNSLSGDSLLYDGLILIKKSSLEEPKIHEKIKKMPNHRKKRVIKKITHFVDVEQKIKNGDIEIIKDCKNEFSQFSLDRYIATHLLHVIYIKYQELGSLPTKIMFIK
ncbi:hypothetical protein QUV98_07785 [Massilimicrobiota timonensis]|uniref:Uncharacterized protein n=1 Tax=Massilimicrobiota timonensis TaxID=1776392 RepID=A0ABT7UJ91_9FIRM|nr:hypothetical protein [Massilimicrobiota timonensis]MDM8196214.1 hypothetical protein [Massilimicrobiota timonensis]